MLSLEEQIERIADAAMEASVESGHVGAAPMRARLGRRSWVGVAAAVMLVGLVGVLIGVIANREPSGTADPAPGPTPMPLSQTDRLNASSGWWPPCCPTR